MAAQGPAFFMPSRQGRQFDARTLGNMAAKFKVIPPDENSCAAPTARDWTGALSTGSRN
jgi:hypothetical protein